jgi:tRNA nucleotidyltransferase (CCA-adding enzyme)
MKGMLTSLTRERVFKELEKTLSEKAPHRFFIFLNEINVLDIVFPEIYEMTLCEHNSKYHMEGSVFNHTMLVLKACSEITENKYSRYAALYHDIGKVSSYKNNGNFYSHYSYEVVESELSKVKERYRVPKKYIFYAMSVALFHHRIHSFQSLRNGKKVKMFTSKLFAKNIEDLDIILKAVIADNFGRIVYESGPERVLDIYDSLFAISQDIFKKGERAYETVYIPGRVIRKDFVDIDSIKRKFVACQSVKVRDFLGEISKVSPETIQIELHRRRIKAIASV